MPNLPPTASPITGTDLISAATIASFVLSVVAILLSLAFFYLSWRQTEKATDAANKIAGTVDKVETLFDTMYSDTFGMVKEAMSDLRKHAWQRYGTSEAQQEVEQKVSLRIEELRQRNEAQLQTIIGKFDATDEKYMSLKRDIGHLLNSTITETLRVENETALEEFLLRVMAIATPSQGQALKLKLSTLTRKLELTIQELQGYLNELERRELVSVKADSAYFFMEKIKSWIDDLNEERAIADNDC